jgi:hypothetical protein
MEGFGETSFLNVPSFEYVGDVYAGFDHSEQASKLQDNVVAKLMGSKLG